MSENYMNVYAFSHDWPAANNTYIQPSTVIETGYEYLTKKDFNYFAETNTYENVVLDIYNTGRTFIYRSYPEPKSCFLRTESVNNLDNFFYEVNDPAIDIIYTLGEGSPGKMYHLTEFNPGMEGIQRFDVQQAPEGADINDVKLFMVAQSLGQVSGELLTFRSALPDIIYENDGNFFEEYSIELPNTFATNDMLNSNYENQLVEYDNLGLYKGRFRNKQLQEFQFRTQGFTYVDTVQYGAIGTIFVTKVKTVNSEDTLRYKKQMKNFDADMIPVDIRNFFPYNQEITLKFTPGIYDITKIKIPYTSRDQVDTYGVTVNPSEGYKTLTFQSDDVFSIEPNENAFWGGWESSVGLPDSFYGQESNFNQLNPASVNAPGYILSVGITRLLNQVELDYPLPDGQPNWAANNLDTFQNIREVRLEETTALHKLTEDGYREGIWNCYTQPPYSSLYNTEF